MNDRPWDGLSHEEQACRPSPKDGSFPDPDALKDQVRKNIMSGEPEYNVSKFYYDTGLARQIAMSPIFEQVTLLVITVNAIWMWIDIDYNNEKLLSDAELHFQFMEHFFCAFFTMELSVRFCAFKFKSNCIRDRWFVFDSALVFMLVTETWVMGIVTAISGASGGIGGLGDASILRLLRLLRLTRMVRLMRAVPELLILVKGMMSATRSVLLTLGLLTVVIYVFAILFVQLTEDTWLFDEYFNTVPFAMYQLLLEGIFPDMATVWKDLAETHWYLGVIYGAFIFLSTLTIINMLIGILVEVVSSVSAAEKEQMDIEFLHGRLQSILSSSTVDVNADGLISKAEFLGLLDNKEGEKALRSCGVDVKGLLDHSDIIFEALDVDVDAEGEDALRPGERKLTFPEFMEVILELRERNGATVKDISNLRKFVHKRLATIETLLLTGQRRSAGNTGRSTPASPHPGRLETPLIMGTDASPSRGSSRPAHAAPAFFPPTVEQQVAEVPLYIVPPPCPVAEVEELRIRVDRLEGHVLKVLQVQSQIMERLPPPRPWPIEANDGRAGRGREAPASAAWPSRGSSQVAPRNGCGVWVAPGCSDLGFAPTQTMVNAS